jgi:DHA3 family tetracycline resistance protein-like MFS transporter
MFGTAATLYRIRIAGLDPLELVLVGTALEVTVLAAEVPTGVVADVVSRRLSILIGFAIMGAGFAFEGTVTSLGPILAAQVVWGLGYTFTSGATQAWIAGEVGDDRAGDVLVRGAAWRRIGGLVGTAAGTAVGVVELRYALLASGAALTASMVWFAAAMRETSFERAEGRTTRLFAEILADGFRVVRGRLLLVAVLVVVVLEGASSEAFDRLWQAHLVDGVGVPWDVPEIVVVGGIGFVIQAVGLVALVTIRPRLGLASAHGLARALVWATVVIVGGLVGLALAPGIAVLVASVFAVYAARVVHEPVQDAWIVRQVPPRLRATVLSAFGQSHALGETAGGPGMGWLARAVSLPASFIASAAVLAPAIAVYARATSVDEPEGAPSPAA